MQPALNATSGPLQCTIPALAPGQSMTIKFKMRAQTLPDKASGGTIYHEASVKPFETEWLSNGGDVIVNNTTTDRTSTDELQPGGQHVGHRAARGRLRIAADQAGQALQGRPPAGQLGNGLGAR